MINLPTHRQEKTIRASNICFAYLDKPYNYSEICETSYGWGLFWIEKTFFVGHDAVWYSLASSPRSRSYGYSGTRKFEDIARLHSNLGCFREFFSHKQGENT